jgi:hypothetical protein
MEGGCGLGHCKWYQIRAGQGMPKGQAQELEWIYPGYFHGVVGQRWEGQRTF